MTEDIIKVMDFIEARFYKGEAIKNFAELAFEARRERPELLQTIFTYASGFNSLFFENNVELLSSYFSPSD